MPTNASAVSVLESVPNAQKVFLAPRWEVTKTWGIGLLQRLVNTQDIVCPKLTSLTLGTLGRGIKANKTTAKPLIQKILKYQSESGVKMDSLKVYWKGHGLKLDEIDYA